MATYAPPSNIEDITIFNPAYFETGDQQLTQNEADKRYLRFPNAQGTENLQAINVTGVATLDNTMIVNGSSSFNGVPTFNNSSIFNGSATFEATADIIQKSGSQILQQPASNTLFSSGNVMNSIAINTTGGMGTTIGLEIRDNVSTNAMYILPNASNNLYDNIVQNDDIAIVTQNSPLVLTNGASASTNGIRLDNTQTLIGYGGSADTPTTSVICNGTNVVINPSLKFPDNSVQSNAYTGAGVLAGSYTSTNMTIDANGKITALSNGGSSVPFMPLYHSFANYQTGTSGYSQGAYINWSSGWGALDYVIIRVRAQVNWSISSGEYNNYATTAGELIIRPHYATAGVMGSLGTPNQFWSTNSGSLFGNVKKLLYYTGAVNNGTQSYFFIYGNGGSGGGASGYIQLMCDAPGTSGGWQYTCLYEYILHSTSGASITFTNGPGGGSG